ncbi:MAG: hypothetical protein C0402_02635 [Thermodesulfovibrio sp.]|nr:hypothetical protein [Thermodesulfovibrio sp.]
MSTTADLPGGEQDHCKTGPAEHTYAVKPSFLLLYLKNILLSRYNTNMGQVIIPGERHGLCCQLAAINKLNLERWLFYPGMRFGERHIWWGNRGLRISPHEGLDLCYYRSVDSSIMTLSAGTLIPVLHDGHIVRIVDDFLGKTIFVKHARQDEDNRMLYSIYGHVIPQENLVPGLHVRTGTVIGILASRSKKTAAPPPHLHLSAALLPEDFSPERLGWDMTASEAKILFIDPLPLIDCAYEMHNCPQV